MRRKECCGGFHVVKVLKKPYICPMAKASKPRRAKYDPKLAIDGTFADVIKVSVNYTPPKQTKKATSAKKKKK